MSYNGPGEFKDVAELEEAARQEPNNANVRNELGDAYGQLPPELRPTTRGDDFVDY